MRNLFLSLLLAAFCFLPASLFGVKYTCAVDLGKIYNELMEENSGPGKAFTKYTIDDVLKITLDDELSAYPLKGELPFGQVFIASDKGYPFVIDQVSNDKKYVLASDIVGRKVLFERKFSVLHSLRLTAPTYQRVPMEKSPFALPPPLAPPQRTVQRPLLNDDFAETLGNNHLENSTSYLAEKDPSRRQAMLDGQKTAARAMFKAFNAKRNLTAKDIDTWNLPIGTAVAPEDTSEAIFSANAVRRGQKGSYVMGDIRYDIDNSTLTHQMEYSPGALIRATKPEDVEPKLNALVDRINAVDSETSLHEIAKIYRDFMFIHPYAEGNGRTGRLVLDYCLMNAGYPPAPPKFKEARLGLWRNEEEAEQALIAAFH